MVVQQLGSDHVLINPTRQSAKQLDALLLTLISASAQRLVSTCSAHLAPTHTPRCFPDALHDCTHFCEWIAQQSEREITMTCAAASLPCVTPRIRAVWTRLAAATAEKRRSELSDTRCDKRGRRIWIGFELQSEWKSSLCAYTMGTHYLQSKRSTSQRRCCDFLSVLLIAAHFKRNWSKDLLNFVFVNEQKQNFV